MWHPRPLADLVAAGKDPARADLLTPREREVLARVLKGAATKDIARTLGVSPRTVAFHRANIMKKFGAKNIVELMRKVMSYGQAGQL